MDQNQINHSQMDQERAGYSYFRGTNISQYNICTVLTTPGIVTNLDSHYVLDACDDVLMQERTHNTRFQNHPEQYVHEIRGHPINHHPLETAPSFRVPTIPSHRGNAIEMGGWIYRSHRANINGRTRRHRHRPPRIFLQVDDIALMSEHHTDMRVDIEDMSYEDLIALGENIGNATSSLSENMITNQMKTKIYSIPTNASNLEEVDVCVICQDEFKDKEKIGILRCRHEYHSDCLRRWLLVKNVCPMCKSEALHLEENDV